MYNDIFLGISSSCLLTLAALVACRRRDNHGMTCIGQGTVEAANVGAGPAIVIAQDDIDRANRQREQKAIYSQL